ncbi:DUF2510 domain-containing protein [Leifsonia virtsii]|uniref:DUF2510 domain-containing protein n=1 Tax=Leifsonia virtsii TaxID=3035915 RepID=A0ABT8J1U4_9MICO|nr:DUF2510 domain-containing protein [Leifsonia virtsii]MDN4599035.1 DUF2510 domain-containing protein [Leifsonia virtsii]
MSTPPGWFPNPANADEEVYWDGDRWTGDKRPVYDPAIAETQAESGDDSGSTMRPEDASGGNELSATPVPSDLEKRKTRKVLWITVAGIVALLVIGGGVTAVVVSNNVHAQQVAAQKAAAKKKAEAEQAKEAAAAAQQAADDAKRSQRRDTVTQVEASIKKMAEDDINKGLLTGPVIGVTCNPVSGSTDDLTDTTTTFDCFVANKDNGDGTSSGYFFNATVNWTSGSYTYGLGKSAG